ncbi:MAG: type IV secretion system protein [Alphaproteobacteria bacterium]|jgi:hypothetical protein|nr:type IV secretion system protein [Alphaproteobacteria bacterium]
MKNLILIIILALSFNSAYITKASAVSFSDGNLGNQIYPTPGLFNGLVEIYNQLIKKTKDTIQTNMDKLTRPATKLLSTMAVVYLLVSVGRSLLVGEYLLKDSVIKVGLMLILTGLLNFKYYNMYVIQNLEVVFNGIPSLLSSNGGGSAIENVINQTSIIAEQIWTVVSGLGWMDGKIIGYAMGILAIFALALLTGVVVINVLFATIKFYLVLSLSSIFILLFFFKFTRSFAMGAVQVVMGAIINLILLSMFLNLFGGVVAGLLRFDGVDFFASCMSIVLISCVGVYLVGVVNEIAQIITAQTIRTGGNMASAGGQIGKLGSSISNAFKPPVSPVKKTGFVKGK